MTLTLCSGRWALRGAIFKIIFFLWYSSGDVEIEDAPDLDNSGNDTGDNTDDSAADDDDDNDDDDDDDEDEDAILSLGSDEDDDDNDDFDPDFNLDDVLFELS